MVTIFIVVSPSGKVAYAGDKQWAAEQFRPTDYTFEQGYECFAVDAETPWRSIPVEPAEVPELGEA